MNICCVFPQREDDVKELQDEISALNRKIAAKAPSARDNGRDDDRYNDDSKDSDDKKNDNNDKKDDNDDKKDDNNDKKDDRDDNRNKNIDDV